MPGLPVTVTDLNESSGGVPKLTPANLTAGPDGTIAGTVELPVGWHKLVFHQAGAQSNIVFVAVGIQPPTVTFPRSDAELGTTPDCSEAGGGKGWRGTIAGTTTYSTQQLGRVYLAEETGVEAMKRSFTPNSVDPVLGTDGLYHFSFSFTNPLDATATGPGRHVLYVFQAPEPPAGATAAQVEAHFRAFASVAARTHMVVNVPPPQYPSAGGPCSGGIRRFFASLKAQVPSVTFPSSASLSTSRPHLGSSPTSPAIIRR